MNELTDRETVRRLRAAGFVATGECGLERRWTREDVTMSEQEAIEMIQDLAAIPEAAA